MSTRGSDSNRISLDSYWQLFSEVSYQFNPDWQGFVQLKNLLDNNYLTHAQGASLTEGVMNRGQEILPGATLQF